MVGTELLLGDTVDIPVEGNPVGGAAAAEHKHKYDKVML